MSIDLPPTEEAALDVFQADECVVEAPYDEATLTAVRKHPEFAEYNEEGQTWVIDVVKNTNENPFQMCLSVNEAWHTAYERADNPDIDTELGYTPEQMIHVDVISWMLSTPEGETLVTIGDANDAWMCVDNNGVNDGYFNANLNIMSYSLAQDEYDVDITDVVADWGPEFSYVLRVNYEEFAHMAQLHEWDMWSPDVGLEYTIVDEKMWDASTEAHARLVTLKALMRHAQNGNPQLISDFINSGDIDVDMASEMMSTYLQHGEEGISKDPTLLAPVFEKFFETSELVDSYYDLNAAYYNALEMDIDLPLADYVRKFGIVPGVEGNILEGRYNDLTDVQNLVPLDSEMGQWLKAHHDAAVDGTKGPDLPTYEADCVAPEEAQSVTDTPNPFEKFDGIGGGPTR